MTNLIIQTPNENMIDNRRLSHIVRFFGNRLFLIFWNEILPQNLPTLAEFVKSAKLPLQIFQIYSIPHSREILRQILINENRQGGIPKRS
jgi:hypothetical protein